MPPASADQDVAPNSLPGLFEKVVESLGPMGHWLILGAGISLMFASELVFFLYGSSNAMIRVLELALPMAVGIGLVWYGFQLRDHEFSSWQIVLLGLSVLCGMALFVVLSGYMQVLLSFEHQLPQEPIFLLLNAMALGAIINFIYAYQYVKVKARADHLENRVNRLTTILSRVSHDLRNPLNVAQGYADLLGTEQTDSERAGSLNEALDRIEALIDELVVFAHSNNAEEHEEAVSLESMAHDSWSMVETESGVLVVESDREFEADPDRLKHLLENLFRNAIVHGGPETTVTVGRTTSGFYVADDGPGIPAETRDSIFEAGFTTDEDGTGLGLNIVAEIVDAHDWEIRVTESEAGGARFEIGAIASRPA